MKNILEKFNNIVEQAHKANKLITANGYKWTTGYGPRFRKMMHYRNKRVHSIGIFDYHTKKYVLEDALLSSTTRSKLLTAICDQEHHQHPSAVRAPIAHAYHWKLTR